MSRSPTCLVLFLATLGACGGNDGNDEPGPAGAGVRIVAGPAASTNQTTAELRVECDVAGCVIECRLDTAAFADCSPVVTYQDLADGMHRFEARAADATGAPASRDWSVDTAAPSVSITERPRDPTNESTTTFGFECDEATCAFACALDGDAFATCASPATFPDLADGEHTLTVRATDAVGNVGAEVTDTWVVDTVAPIVTLTAAPDDPTNDSDATFTFECSEGACTTSCELDGGGPAPCVSPTSFSGLADGEHTLTVRGTDPAGNVGTAASRTWVVDTIAPVVTFTSFPPDPTNQVAAVLEVACNESVCTLACSLDDAPFAICTSPVTYSALAPGSHRVAVRATDSATNTGAPAIYTWTIDLDPPTTTIASGPPSYDNQSSATFVFSADEPATFACRVTGGAWSSCSSPFSSSALPDGVQTLEVRATDLAGNGEVTPPVWTWTIDTGAMPTLATLFPASGTVGLPLILEGAGFGANQGTRWISVAGQLVEVKSWSDRYIVVVVPLGLPAGLVDVVVEPYASATLPYRVVPWIHTIEPRVLAPGDTLWATGASFGDVNGAGSVGFGAATIDDWSDTVVQLQAPAFVPGGRIHVQLTTAAGEPSNRFPVTARGNDVWIPLDDTPSPRSDHTAVWTGTEMIVWGGISGNVTAIGTGSRYDPVTDSWAPTSDSGAPSPRYRHTAIWTGTEMIVWGGANSYPVAGGRYDPVTDTWQATSTSGAPIGRYDHTAIWTGSEMIVWGGVALTVGYLDSGGRYDPATDTWTSTSTTDAPEERIEHTAVWTGNRMIVWGGGGNLALQASGASYDPGTDLWTALPVTGAPPARKSHSAVWTGTEMIVWGGYGTNFRLNSGGRYDPAAGTWTTTSTTNAPSARALHTGIWTGSKMIIWAGDASASTVNTGGTYDPALGTWTSTSTAGAPARRHSHTAVWTGTEMIVWGGDGFDVDIGGRYVPATDGWTSTAAVAHRGSTEQAAVWTGSEMIVWGGASSNAGLRYDPITDTWTSTSLVGATISRSGQSAVWTGSEMIIWGGRINGAPLHSGARYSPVTDTWASTTTVGAPTARSHHVAVWTGTEMIVWGGHGTGYQLTGARYSPATDSWTSTSTASAPAGRHRASAVWTGSEMIVWGGFDGAYVNTGGRYTPSSDAWTSTATSGAPVPRMRHTAVWTGDEMIVWGGYSGAFFRSGGRYVPASNSWTSTPTIGAPTARAGHTAVWTGTEMIVWGGDTGAPPFVSYVATGARFATGTATWTDTPVAGAPAGRSDHTAVWTGSEMIIWGGGPDAPGGKYTP